MHNHQSKINVEDFLFEQLIDPRSQWSIGTFGAIAEFSNAGSDAVAAEKKPGRLKAVTAHGAISVKFDKRCRPFASESIAYQGWSQRVALCMKAQDAQMNARSVLTEVGPDTHALRPEDRDSILFDLGLAVPHIDFCIRVRDTALLARLLKHEGRPLYEAENPSALEAILTHSPDRVFLSQIGRVEVFQPIPRHGEKSPEGPHTHVLPKLLKQGRIYAATEPIPNGFVPCLHVYPWHPADVSIGNHPTFDPDQHSYFQMVLRSFGSPDAIAIKDMVTQSVICEHDPPRETFAKSRIARANVRIALRQLAASNCASRTLSSWISTFDRVRGHERALYKMAGECNPRNEFRIVSASHYS